MVSATNFQTSKGEGGVGSVFADIEVSNMRDEILAQAGHLAPDRVRRVRLERVLVDTGASTLRLPIEVVEQLGLTIKRRVVATTAAGDIETTIHDQAQLFVAGREGVVECIALPRGARPLLGVIPLEMLGLEPDLVGQTLRVLPDNNKDTYIFAY